MCSAIGLISASNKKFCQNKLNAIIRSMVKNVPSNALDLENNTDRERQRLKSRAAAKPVLL